MPDPKNPYEQRRMDIEEKMEHPLPTPCVGEWVIWYHMGKVDPDNMVAALVTRIEEPGKVTLEVHRPNSVPIHKQGVHYKDDPRVENRRQANVVSNGLWELRPCDRMGKRHFERHLKVLQRQLDAARHEEFLASERERNLQTAEA